MMSLISRFEMSFSPYFFEKDAPTDVYITAAIRLGSDGFEVTVSAPLSDAPAPAFLPGRVENLWRHEVVEVFLLGKDDRYLELEFGPHGHFWILELHGCRHPVGDVFPLHHEWHHDNLRWEATVRLPAEKWPAGLFAFNVTCIFGTGRHHGSLVRLPGDVPDFHQLDQFTALIRSTEPFPRYGLNRSGDVVASNGTPFCGRPLSPVFEIHSVCRDQRT